MYICLEGIDGSGKSTQIEFLIKWLDDCGIDVLKVFEPTESPAGKLNQGNVTKSKCYQE